MPIIDLMAASNAHFKKLKDFITLTLPAGFPVKIGLLQFAHWRVLLLLADLTLFCECCSP